MLKNKCVIVGVSGGIAAYKSATLVSMLKKAGCDVHVIMTENAMEFIAPLTFETLTENKCYVDTFDRQFKYDVEHISLAKKADLIIVAPATANVMAKLSNGIADDMLTTVVLASKATKILGPAMNSQMYLNPITQDNMKKLKHYGFEIIEPDSGLLACGDVGVGKMPDPEILYNHVIKHIAMEKDLVGKKVVVTAGPTREKIDPVRFISNNSTGKMGFAIAKAAMLRGADVTLISGMTSIEPPLFVNTIPVLSAEDMYNAVMENIEDADFLFKAAAVADYTPSETHDNKVKKKDGDLAIGLKRTKDILMEVGKVKGHNQVVCGFSMETENLIENSTAKLEKKNADMIIANNLKDPGAGFGTDTNLIKIITKDGIRELPLMDKFDVANSIIDAAKQLGE